MSSNTTYSLLEDSKVKSCAPWENQLRTCYSERPCNWLAFLPAIVVRAIVRLLSSYAPFVSQSQGNGMILVLSTTAHRLSSPHPSVLYAETQLRWRTPQPPITDYEYLFGVSASVRVIRLSLGRCSVNLLPVPQRTNALTNGVVDRPWIVGRDFESHVHHKSAFKRKVYFLMPRI